MQSQRFFFGMEEDLAETVEDTAYTLEVAYCIKERIDELGVVLEKLSKKDRDLLHYKYFLEMTDKEISELICVKPESVKTLMKRARDRALILLKEEDEFHHAK